MSHVSYAATKKTHEASGLSFSARSIYWIFCGVEVGKNPENPRFSYGFWLLMAYGLTVLWDRVLSAQCSRP
jgi:hypothetical protein